jgi:hypothetical protein
MKRVVDYTIVIAGDQDIEDLKDEVKEKLAEGWHPLGAPFLSGKNLSYLTQALVKYGE